jgi:hypothetical protein
MTGDHAAPDDGERQRCREPLPENTADSRRRVGSPRGRSISVGRLRPVAATRAFGGAGAAFDRLRPGKTRPTLEECGGDWRSPAEGRDSNAGQPSRSIARRGDKPERCEGWTPGLEGPSSDRVRSGTGLDTEPPECVQECIDTPIRLSYNGGGIVGRSRRPRSRRPAPQRLRTGITEWPHRAICPFRPAGRDYR